MVALCQLRSRGEQEGMGKFSRLHDTWMETRGIYMTEAEAPMASMSFSMQCTPFCLPTAVSEPQKRARLSVWFLFVCMSIVLLLPFCLGIQTEQTELKTESVSWNTKEWGERGTYLLWDSKMLGPGKWQASEKEACEDEWKRESEYDGNKIVTTSTNEIQQTSHSQEALVMDDTSNSLRGDSNTSSAVAEKVQEAIVQATQGNSIHLSRLVHDLVQKQEASSMKEYLRDDGLLSEGDILRLAKLLDDLGFASRDDLEILGTAFFETMVDEEHNQNGKVPAVMVYKLWRTLHRSGHVPTDDHGDARGYGAPSYPTTLAIMEQRQMNKRLWENRRSEVVKAKHPDAPAEKATTFDNLHEHTIKLQESAYDEVGGGDPHETSTGTPAFQRVKQGARAPDAARVAFSSQPEYADKFQAPTKRRQSGILNPDVLFGRNEEEKSNNLWSALPDFDTSMTNNLGVQSAEGAEVQRKLREKMIVNAVSELSPFNGIPEDFIEWRDNAVITFRQAGRGAVLLPNFHEWAEYQGWTQQDIDEADEWAHVILKAALSGCDDALDVFNCAPAGEGSTAFAFLRRHYELLSSNVKEKLRMKIEKFAPLTGEDPLRMIARLNKMYVSYAKSINPEPQSTESKIRKVLTMCAKFSSLSVKIKMIRSSLSSGDRPPRKMTHVHTVHAKKSQQNGCHLGRKIQYRLTR